MKPDVELGIEQLRKHFHHSAVSVKEDESGGAYILVEPVDIGPDYTDDTRHTWIGFHIAYNYPIPDIYPHHVRPDLQRLNGSSLQEGMHIGNRFAGFDRPSVMVSRRTTVQSSWVDQTALVKLLKIIEWCGGSTERCA